MTDIRVAAPTETPPAARVGPRRARVNPITVFLYTLLVVLAAIYIYPFLVQVATG
ncbi:MAG: carbohydrate ABC transporter permease, partial [Jiangellaceae bacterium]|nr:carbohydrate ABC transporter permease [Jiangellaceae bacterium]